MNTANSQSKWNRTKIIRDLKINRKEKFIAWKSAHMWVRRVVRVCANAMAFRDVIDSCIINNVPIAEK